jgi:Carboxypeptidase regulatory-like domain
VWHAALSLDNFMMLTSMLARRLRRSILPLLMLCAAPAIMRAQVGATTDIITGVVRTPAGVAVENAQVEAFSTETQVTRRQRTNAQGKYTILFPDGGGTYRLTVRYIGFAPTTLTLTRNGDDDRIVRNITLGQSTAQTLARVEVRGTQRRGNGPLIRQPSRHSRQASCSRAQIQRAAVVAQISASRVNHRRVTTSRSTDCHSRPALCRKMQCAERVSSRIHMTLRADSSPAAKCRRPRGAAPT